MQTKPKGKKTKNQKISMNCKLTNIQGNGYTKQTINRTKNIYPNIAMRSRYLNKKTN